MSKPWKYGILMFVLLVIRCSSHERISIDFTLEAINSDVTKEFAKDKRQIESNVTKALHTTLPRSISLDYHVIVRLINDKQERSFVNNDTITINIADLGATVQEHFTNVLAHELHHIIYQDWLEDNTWKEPNNDNYHAFYWWQFHIITEGIAQRINYENYPDQIKKLYNNDELLKDLTEFWILNQRRIMDSSEPKVEYQEIQNYMWSSYSFGKLAEYIPNYESIKEISQFRPTVDYYVGYHLYNTIFSTNGQMGLYEAIENPKYLLRNYNKAITKTNPELKIDDDIVQIWEDNIKSTAPNKRYVQ